MDTARSLLRTLTLLAAAAALPASTDAQDDGPSASWRFMTRATISGNSYESSPEGYEIFGGLSLEGALARNLNEIFAVELSLRTESREVEGPASLPEPRLGSIEVVPVSLTVKWQPMERTDRVFQPFAGGGINMTYVWEKSGLLDSSDPPISFAPVVQMGSHLALSPRFLLTADVKWHPLDVELEGVGFPVPTVDIDPLILGAGFAFAF